MIVCFFKCLIWTKAFAFLLQLPLSPPAVSLIPCCTNSILLISHCSKQAGIYSRAGVRFTCERETHHAKCCCGRKWDVFLSANMSVSVFRTIYLMLNRALHPEFFSFSLGIQTSVVPVTNLLPEPWGYRCPINMSQVPAAAQEVVR